MPRKLPQTRTKEVYLSIPAERLASNPNPTSVGPESKTSIGTAISVLQRSEGHPVNRKTGKRESGGPFSVYHTGTFIEPGHVTNAYAPALGRLYTGPVAMAFKTGTPLEAKYAGVSGVNFDDSKLEPYGTTAIAQCAPTNATAGLSSALAESFREGIPSLPGIQSWKKRTEILRSAGSEYLNYQFGWQPLRSEVKNVAYAAKHHRDLLQNYRHNEGKNVHRSFHFPDETTLQTEDLSSAYPFTYSLNSNFAVPTESGASRVKMSLETTRKRWFEGCFTYGGPSEVDSFRRALGFGSDADALFGLTLSPDVLWDLTPWSWAVDWFTNAGDVIHNVTNFALAGLVMRYGYMMEETSSTYYCEYFPTQWNTLLNVKPKKVGSVTDGACKRGETTIRKSRCPANPFGFGVGWEGLSPTQLAITAALGITRVL